jgi:hypothetical protein
VPPPFGFCTSATPSSSGGAYCPIPRFPVKNKFVCCFCFTSLMIRNPFLIPLHLVPASNMSRGKCTTYASTRHRIFLGIALGVQKCLRRSRTKAPREYTGCYPLGLRIPYACAWIGTVGRFCRS